MTRKSGGVEIRISYGSDLEVMLGTKGRWSI